MKKLFSLFVLVLTCVNFVSAQWGDGILSTPKRIWTDPVIYNYDENVTWYFDLSNQDPDIKTILDEATLALWTWIPSNPGDGHFGGGYSIAQPEMTLTHRGGYVYSITMKPTEFYNVTKSYIENPHYANGDEMTGFVMHVRVFSKNGDANINCAAFIIRYPHFLIKDLKAAGTQDTATVYPSAANATTPLAALLYNGGTFSGDLHVKSSVNNGEKMVSYDALNPDLTKAKTYFGINDVYVFNILNPSQYFGVAYDYTINSLEFEFAEVGQTVVHSGSVVLTPVDAWQPTISGLGNITTVSGNMKLNISNGLLTINAPQFAVYNICGVRVANSNASTLDISNLTHGTYIVKTAHGTIKFNK